MKHITNIICLALVWGACCKAPAQTVSNFENLSLTPGAFWDGSDFSGGFTSGNAFFPNVYVYDSLYGGYWDRGFAYSNMKDSTTAGFMNMYSARPATGYGSSEKYAIGQDGAVIELTGNAAGKAVFGLYVTNSTYAALSMRDGDMFAKKFGGPTGDDPDWFRLSITGYEGYSPIADTVHFYLADYRFVDNGMDYIVEDWRWVDLTPLGNLDSVFFFLSSSDIGVYGMNTPPFFCIDNFTTADSPAGLYGAEIPEIKMFPNPAHDRLSISFPETWAGAEFRIFSPAGAEVLRESVSGTNIHSLHIHDLPAGMYVVRISSGEERFHYSFIKTRF
jgi:hypothetical protein